MRWVTAIFCFLVTTTAIAGEILVINVDNSHFFGSRTEDQMTVEGLNAFIDQYAGTKVSHLFFSPNAMCANFPSKTRSSIWDSVSKRNDLFHTRWPANAKLLAEKGLDPYMVWIARCRKKGISPWISMRMNDVHSVNDPENFMHSAFWKKNPQFRRVPNVSMPSSPCQNYALNFAHKEVYAYNLAFVRELLERYDIDGIELDWMRFGWHLTPGKEAEEAHILTGFVADVHKIVYEVGMKRGKRIQLAARVPAHPDAAAGLGMDGVEWVKRGLIDWLIPCPFWTTSDFDIPVELWKERIAAVNGTKPVRVTPGIEANTRPFGKAVPVANDIALLYGWSASALHRGADGLYLFNWMSHETLPVGKSNYVKMLDKGLSKDVLSVGSRRYASAFRDMVPVGFPNGEQLPKRLNKSAKFTIPATIAARSQNVYVILGLKEKLVSTTLTVTLNRNVAIRQVDESNLAQFGGKPLRAIRFEFPASALKDGANTIVVKQAAGPMEEICWVEIAVR